MAHEHEVGGPDLDPPIDAFMAIALVAIGVLTLVFADGTKSLGGAVLAIGAWAVFGWIEQRVAELTFDQTRHADNMRMFPLPGRRPAPLEQSAPRDPGVVMDFRDGTSQYPATKRADGPSSPDAGHRPATW